MDKIEISLPGKLVQFKERGGESSAEEVHFSWYLDELLSHDLILGWGYQNPTFHLFDKVEVPWIEQMKTKTKQNIHTLFQPGTYTSDFYIKLRDDNPQTMKLFLNLHLVKKDPYPKNPYLRVPFFYSWMFDELFQYCFIDVKGTFSGRGSQREGDVRFPVNQKIVWDKYGHYVNKAIPKKLFASTFTPRKFLFTDMGKQLRVIHFKTVTIEEYFKL